MERRVHKKQAAQKLQHDQHARERSFTIGQKVMVKNLRPGPAWIAAEITKQLGPVTFLVRVRDGQTWKRHVDHLKVLHDNPCKTVCEISAHFGKAAKCRRFSWKLRTSVRARKAAKIRVTS